MIDKKYQAIQAEKVCKIKQKNREKKSKHDKKMQERLADEEKCLFKKYAVEKREKKMRVIKNLNK